MSHIEELRVALTVDDFERAVRFYRDALNLEVRQEWDDADGRGVILELPRATLEILNRPQADAIDRIETDAVRQGDVRIAVRVNALEAAVDALEGAGATRVHVHVRTPWGHHNQRLETPDGRQLTVFSPEQS
jgi:catechol 2,3-dioxygenase-like lactoylglutathione lyase family enzyme